MQKRETPPIKFRVLECEDRRQRTTGSAQPARAQIRGLVLGGDMAVLFGKIDRGIAGATGETQAC